MYKRQGGGFGSLVYLSSRSVGPIEPGRAPSVYDPIEIDTPDQDVGPSELGSIESIFDILMDIMAGTQGTIEGLDEKTIDSLLTAVEGTNAEELLVVAQEIADAGGYAEWLAQQETGDPGGVVPEPQPEPEPEPEPPEQQTCLLYTSPSPRD